MAAAAPPKITIPADFKTAPLDKVIEAITRAVYRVGDDEQRGRIHPEVASLRRWELKSAVKLLQDMQRQQANQSEESTA